MNVYKPKIDKVMSGKWWQILLVIAILATTFSFGVMSRPSVAQAASAQVCKIENRYDNLNWPQALNGVITAHVDNFKYCWDGAQVWQSSDTFPDCSRLVKTPAVITWRLEDCSVNTMGRASVIKRHTRFNVVIKGFGQATYDWTFLAHPDGSIDGQTLCSSAQTQPFGCATGYTP